ncbi:MAG: hypothetical protein IJL75_01435 [Eubacterium sp.]|nr:hypothetical protein [Eubacterium sp.]
MKKNGRLATGFGRLTTEIPDEWYISFDFCEKYKNLSGHFCRIHTIYKAYTLVVLFVYCDAVIYKRGYIIFYINCFVNAAVIYSKTLEWRKYA